MDESERTGLETTPLLASKDHKNYAGEPRDGLTQSPVVVHGDGQVQAEVSVTSAEKGTDKDDTHFSIGGLSRRQKTAMVLLAAANLFSGCGFSLPAPFLPQEAAKKGASNTMIGLIFSSYQLVIFIFSPIYGNYITRIGPKFMFVAGILLGGACSVLFGVLDKCPSGNQFIIMCFICRSVEAMGMAGMLTASFAIISNEFPKHVATVFGGLETASGIGMMIGPAIGGVLYQVGGFGIPFYFMGVLIILNGILIYIFLPEIRDDSTPRKQGAFKLFSSVSVWVCMMIIFTVSTGISFTDPTLSPHLETFHLSTAVIGLVFTIAPALYGIMAPLFGYLSDSKGYTFSLLILGNMGFGISFLLIGPSPYLTFLPSELWVVIIGWTLLGFSIGCAVIPVVKCMLEAAYDIGFENNLDTYGLVSGLFNSVWCFGGFVGPTLGGILVNEVGFRHAASIIALFSFCAVLCTSLYYLISKGRRGGDAANQPIGYTQGESTSPSPSEDAAQVGRGGANYETV